MERKACGHAQSGLKASLKARGDPPRIDEDAVRDLLADLGHFCDREGYGYRNLLTTAKRDWLAER